MKEVEVNGTILEFPDDMADDAIKDVLRRKFSTQPKADAGALPALAASFNRNVVGFPADVAANIMDLGIAGYGTAKRLIGGAGTEMPDPVNRSRLPLTSEWFRRTMPSVFDSAGADEHPYAQGIGAGMSGAVLGGPSSVGQTVARGLVGGASGATATGVREAGGSNEAQVLASLAVPAAIQTASTVMSARPPLIGATAGKQAEQSLRPYTDRQIADAIALQRESVRLKNPITAAQALAQVAGGGGGRMRDLESYVMDSPHAPKHMLQAAQDQPNVARQFSEQVAGVFGPPNRSLARANQIESAADTAMEMPRKTAGQAVKPIYDMIAETRPQLPEAVRWKLAGQLEELNRKVGLLEQSSGGQAVGDVARRTTVESPIVSAKGQPFRRAEGGIYELDNYLKELRTRIEKVSSVNPDAKQLVEQAGLRPAHEAIRSELIAASPELGLAKKGYQTIKQIEDARVRSTGIPDMSRRFNSPDVSSKTAASWSNLEKLITKPQADKDLREAAKILGPIDAQALPDVTKVILRDKFDTHFTNRQEVGAAADFARDVRSIPNIGTAIELTAKAQGLPGKAAADGFMKFLDVAEASGLERGRPGGGQTPQQINRDSPARSGVSMLFGHGIARAGTLVRNINYQVNRKQVEMLVRNIDSPDSLNNLVKLSKAPQGSQMFKSALDGLLYPSDEARMNMVLPLTSGLLGE